MIFFTGVINRVRSVLRPQGKRRLDSALYPPEKQQKQRESREMALQGGIFDIDGVLLDTPLERAWREVLEELMNGPWRALAPQSTYPPSAFTSAVYQEHIAGKPRPVP